jgi:hypothetical protein
MRHTPRHAARARIVLLVLGSSIIAACGGSSGNASIVDSGAALAGASATAAHSTSSHAAAPADVNDSLLVRTWKSPTCGCCGKWVDYMRNHGYRVTTTDVADVTPVKREHGVLEKDQSCHTSLIGGYVVEGHVPVEDIRRMLAERPDIVGLAAPGMPAGSPGMETGTTPRYDVIAIGKDGSRKVFATHGGSD